MSANKFADLPLADRGHTWDADGADKRVRAWADAEKKPNGKYGEAFLVQDEDGSRFGDYKLPFADVLDGKLTAIPKGIFAAAAAIQGARGGVKLSTADEDAAKAHIAQYYAKMAKAFDDKTLTPPWDRSLADVVTRALGQTVFRDTEIDLREIDKKARTLRVAFSSETPVDRPFGKEILDHSEGSIRMTRLKNGAPLLLNHDTDKQIGVVENAHIGADKKGRATVRFGNSPLANEVFQDVQDGIRRSVSVGYQLHSEPAPETDQDGNRSFRFKDWEPLELSLVPIPGDTSVGVGRSHTPVPKPTPSGESTMDPKEIEQLRLQTTEEARRNELDRIKAITAIGTKFKREALAEKFITEGKSIEEFRSLVLDELGSAAPLRAAVDDPNIGMGTHELKRYSVVRALAAMADPANKKLRELAAFEYECSQAAQKRYGGAKERPGTRGEPFTIPFDVLATPNFLQGSDEQKRAALERMQRDLAVGGTAGSLVATELLAADFIQLLRVATKVMKLGARHLTGLVGNIAIPAQTGGATCYWVAEDGAATESDSTFGQVILKPSSLVGYTQLSRLILLQSSLDIENLVREDLIKQIAIALDLAAINGSGAAGQPLGILGTTGINSIALGTNGGAPAWANMVYMISALMKANAYFGRLGWLGNGQVWETLMTTPRIGTTYPVFILNDPGNSLLGAPFEVSQNVPANLTKGTGTALSATLFGNWGDLLIGQWGGLDMVVDPYSNSKTGQLNVLAWQDIGIGIRHPVSFSAIVDMITT